MTTVLVVDDEPEIRSSLRGVLSDEGLRVIEAEDGRQARDLVRAERPELVLLDVWMPEIDGIELLRWLQEEPSPPQVIMISGHGNIEMAVKATKLGAFDFIEKPFSLDTLLQTVNRALEQRALTAGDDSVAALSGARVGEHGRDVSERAGRRVERTIKRSVVASGHGLHSGVKSGLILHPLPPGRGIIFSSISDEAAVPAHLDYVDSTGYATTLHRSGMTVRTVEHLLATLHAYGITNLLIKVQSEVPTMDGSAIEFCQLIDGAGVEDQGGEVEEIVVDRRVVVGQEDDGEGESIAIEPHDGFQVSYTLIYPPPVGRQEYTYVHRGPASFCEDVAPARTFGFLKDLKAMAAMGLASGGRLDNCILIDDEKVVNTALRFPNEFARHKILDIMGDLYLLNRPVRGHVIARKTGHADNIALLRVIRDEIARDEVAVRH
jgi:UDP-3-O-acyl N-acetylglucosamine deacetylase